MPVRKQLVPLAACLLLVVGCGARWTDEQQAAVQARFDQGSASLHPASDTRAQLAFGTESDQSRSGIFAISLLQWRLDGA